MVISLPSKVILQEKTGISVSESTLEFSDCSLLVASSFPVVAARLFARETNAKCMGHTHLNYL